MTMGSFLGNRFLITGVEQPRKGFLTPNRGWTDSAGGGFQGHEIFDHGHQRTRV